MRETLLRFGDCGKVSTKGRPSDFESQLSCTGEVSISVAALRQLIYNLVFALGNPLWPLVEVPPQRVRGHAGTRPSHHNMRDSDRTPCAGPCSPRSLVDVNLPECTR